MAYRAGVVVDLKVRFIFRCFRRLRFAEVLALAHMVLIQLGKEGLVGSLREHALLLQDGQDTHRLPTYCNMLETESVHEDDDNTNKAILLASCECTRRVDLPVITIGFLLILIF